MKLKYALLLLFLISVKLNSIIEEPDKSNKKWSFFLGFCNNLNFSKTKSLNSCAEFNNLIKLSTIGNVVLPLNQDTVERAGYTCLGFLTSHMLSRYKILIVRR